MSYEIKADVLDGVFEPQAADPVAELKAEVAALRERMVKAGRPPAGATETGGEERKAFVEGYLRRGSLAGVELKGLSAGTPSDGGLAVPDALDRMIAATLKDISPIRRIANVVTVGQANYRKLITTGSAVSGWVAETAGRPETDTPDFVEIAPPTGELYANPAASQTMIDDAMFDVESWLAAEIGSEFAKAEGAAFVGGSGVNRPRGFLSYPTSSALDSVRAFGTLQHQSTGVSGAFGVDAGSQLIDFVHALRPAYRQGASFVMNSKTLATIRKLKDNDGNFLWRPGLGEGQPQALLGYPVVEAEDMPDIAADALAVAFGNFRAGYVIAEAAATRILRDPFSNKPFVHFYATKRVGGAVVDSQALKLLKFGV